MKTPLQFRRISALGVAAGLLLAADSLLAQDRPPQGNFDPAQMRQRMLERMRQQFEVADDSEWKIISEGITKVMDARRAVGGGGPGGFGFFGGPGGPPPSRPDGNTGPGQSQGAPQPPGGMGGGPGGPAGPGGFNRESNPELEVLRKAIEAKASATELKAKLAQLRAARKQKEAELEKAQEELRQILSVRQEAVAVTFGLLK